MGKTIRIKVNMDRDRLRGNMRRLAKVLAGTDTTHSGFRNKFWGVFTREMFRRLHTSFRARSRGEADDLGVRWTPLKKSTIKRKSREHGRGGLYPGVRVPASPHPGFANRDTEELFKSFAMGALGASYRPTENQVYSLQGTNIILGTSAKHAKEADRLRQLIPRDIGPWVKESIAIAIEKTIHLLPKLGH